MKKQKNRKRLLSAVLSLALVFSMTGTPVFATGSGGATEPCEHHTTHTADCGYAEAVEGEPCSHLNEDGTYSCAPIEDEDEASPSNAEETYQCDHTDSCGLVEAEDGSPCAYICEICQTEDSGEPQVDADEFEAGIAPIATETPIPNSSLTYTLENGTLTISGTGNMPDYKMSSPPPWRANTDDITGIEIGSGVTSIGKYAFQTCSNLVSVVLPESLLSIGNYAFDLCASLESITIPTNITNIGNRAFSDTALKTITFEGDTPTIGTGAFANLSTTGTVTVPTGKLDAYKTALTTAGMTFSDDAWTITDGSGGDTTPQPTIGTNNVYANGAPLLIVEDGSGTTVYVDTNKNGTVDIGEKSLSDLGVTGAPADQSDLSNYAVYGGSFDDNLTGDTSITMTGGKVKYIYAGGDESNVTGDTNVTMTGGTVSTIVGGSYGGTVTGNANVKVTGGAVEQSISASGRTKDGIKGHVTGKGSIEITGGSAVSLNASYGAGSDELGSRSLTVGGTAKIGVANALNGVFMGAEIGGFESFAISATTPLSSGAFVQALYYLDAPAENAVIATGAKAGDADYIKLVGDAANGKEAYLDGTDIKIRAAGGGPSLEQTQTLYVSAQGDGKLRLDTGGASGTVIEEGTHYTGSYSILGTTLTLTDFVFKTSADQAFYISSVIDTIVLVGNSSIETTYNTGGAVGISCEDALTISGTGTLAVTAGNNTAMTNTAFRNATKLTLKDSAALALNVGASSIGKGLQLTAFGATGTLEMKDTAKITVTITDAGTSYVVNSESALSNAVKIVDENGTPITKTVYDGYKGTYAVITAASTPSHVAVTDITGVPTTATVGTDLTLTGTVAPADATNQTIAWSVKNAGTTGATISGSTLSTTSAGTVTVTATIANGATASTDYTKDFTITVNSAATTATATVSDVTISGKVGEKISSAYFTVTIQNDEINKAIGVSQDADIELVQNMVTNAPAGIEIWASNWLNVGDTSFELMVDDSTPTAASYEPLAITIPGSILKGGQDIVVTTNPNAKWNITSASSFVAVTGITGVPTTATVGTDLTLTGTVAPADATNKTIVWSVKDAGTTGATISGSTLSTTSAGTVTVTATIANGATASTDYTEDFTITVNSAATAASATVSDVTISGTVGEEIDGYPNFEITLVNDEINGDYGINDNVVKGMVTNIPDGVEAIGYNTLGAGDTSFKLQIKPSTPTKASSEALEITIPGSILKGGNDIVVTPNPNAKWNITSASSFVAVTGITGVPTTATVGTDLTLTGTVAPETATNKTIAWSVKDAGTTGATISGSTLSTTAAGTVTVTATIANGATASTDYTKDFTITVNSAATTATATVSDVTISGKVGEKISSAYFTVTIQNDEINKAIGVSQDADIELVQNMVTNAPAGIEIWASNWLNVGDTSFELMVDDSTPTAASYEPLAITIPGSILKGGQDIVVTTNPNAKWNITDGSASTAYTVTISGGGSGASGSGSYETGKTVTINAGTKSNYTFTGWTGGVAFANASSASTTFVMPGNNVTVTANWSYNGGGSSGGGGGSSSGSQINTSKPSESMTGSTTTNTTVDANGNANITVTSQNVNDAIAAAKAEATKKGVNVKDVSVVIHVATDKAATQITTNLPKTVQDSLISNQVGAVEIKSDTVTMRFSQTAIQQINSQAQADVTITAAKTDNSKLTGEAKTLVGSRPVFNFTATYGDGKAITNFGTNSVYLAIPYTLGQGEKAENVQVYYIDANGALHGQLSTYDKNLKAAVVVTNHFSTYAVGYKPEAQAFTDIASHWAKSDIEFVSARGLLEGTGKTTFSPDSVMTRGMFVTALGRLAGINPNDYKTSSFTDVKASAYYAPYVEWAAQKGIVTGTGDKQFSPDAEVTREQMAVIMVNYAGQMGYSIPTPLGAVTFADNASISEWAAKEVSVMQQAGVLMGKDGNKFDPQGKATRAEVSAVLHRFVELVIDTTSAQGWTKNDSGHWLYYKNGAALTGGWQTVDGLRYYFNMDGVMHEGWKEDTTANKWYYWDTNGAAIGWKQIDGKWYYFNNDGTMAVNTKVDGYEIGADGVRKEQ